MAHPPRQRKRRPTPGPTSRRYRPAPGRRRRPARRWRRALALCLLLSSLASPPARAQDPDPPPDPDQPPDAAARLDDADPHSLDPILVDAPDPEDRVFEPGAARVETLTSDRARRLGAATLSDLLAWLAAATSVDGSGTTSGLIIDGLPASQVVVLRDGRPISRARGTQAGTLVDLSSLTLHPDQVVRVDVYRGNGPASAGRSGGVVIDIITARPRATHARASSLLAAAAAGLYRQLHRASASVTPSPSWALSASALHARADALDVNGDAIDDTPQTRLANGELQAGWAPPGGAARLDALANVTWRRLASLGAARAPLHDLTTSLDARAALDGAWRLRDALDLRHATNLLWSHHDFYKVVRQSGYERPKSRTEALDARQTLGLTAWLDDHDLRADLDLTLLHVAREGETGALDPVTEVGATLGVTHTWYVTPWFEWQAALLGDLHATFDPAARADLGATFLASDHLSLSLSASRSQRLPSAEERFLAFDHSEVGYRLAGAPDLTPETLHGARAGFTLSVLDDHLALEAQGFYNHLHDAITATRAPDDRQVDGAAALFTYANTLEAQTAGINASLTARGLPGHLTLRASHAWLPLARDRASAQRLPLRAHHAARAELRGAWLDDRLDAWIDVAARSPLSVPAGSVAAPAHALLGAGVRYQPLDLLRLTLDANNLLNQTNATWGPRPGFHVLLTVEALYLPDAQP